MSEKRVNLFYESVFYKKSSEVLFSELFLKYKVFSNFFLFFLCPPAFVPIGLKQPYTRL